MRKIPVPQEKRKPVGGIQMVLGFAEAIPFEAVGKVDPGVLASVPLLVIFIQAVH